MLRGSSLRNTEWVVGVVVYSGHDTKIMMNSANTHYKLSSIEKETNRLVFIVLFIQLVLCIVAATYASIWKFSHDITYLSDPPNAKNRWDQNKFLFWLMTAGTWLILFANLLPISLLVTLEMVKLA